MDKPTRKDHHLTEYDYSQAGAYFVTICTKDRQPLLSNIHIVGEGLCALPHIQLTSTGEMVDRSIDYLQHHIPGVKVDKYVIMPNHIHMLVQIFETGGRRGPPLHKIIGQFKSYTTHCHRQVLWQRSYYDHIVRGEQDYREIWEYIDENPLRWSDDVFYSST